MSIQEVHLTRKAISGWSYVLFLGFFLLLRCFGSGEGRDGYDAIEYLATLPWSNGKLALVGNSWLAMAQWHIAAERPPHLTCIAPLEGCSDFYRETLNRGGVPYRPFWSFLAQHGLFGKAFRILYWLLLTLTRTQPPGGCAGNAGQVSLHERVLGRQTSPH